MTDRRTTIRINSYEGRVRVSTSTCIRGTCASCNASCIDLAIRGSAHYTTRSAAAAPKVPYTRRGARDIALSMIIRHVNSIIRSTSVAPCDLSGEIHSRGRSTTFMISRYVRLVFRDLRGNRNPQKELYKRFFY